MAPMLIHLGDAHYAAGDVAEARLAWQEALAILDELEQPDADEVRARLLGQGQDGPPGAPAAASRGPLGRQRSEDRQVVA